MALLTLDAMLKQSRPGHRVCFIAVEYWSLHHNPILVSLDKALVRFDEVKANIRNAADLDGYDNAAFDKKTNRVIVAVFEAALKNIHTELIRIHYAERQKWINEGWTLLRATFSRATGLPMISLQREVKVYPMLGYAKDDREATVADLDDLDEFDDSFFDVESKEEKNEFVVKAIAGLRNA